MNITTTEPPVEATGPTPMPYVAQKHYTQTLSQHRELILDLGNRYMEDGHPQWRLALSKEPQHEPLLLIGDGPRASQLRRLANAWMKFSGRRKPQVKSNKYEGSQCARFDEHRQRLEVMAQAYRTQQGGIRWKDALKDSPELARDIGYADLPLAGKRKLTINLGFWYRDRVLHGRGITSRVRVGPAPKSRENGRPEPVVSHGPGPRFCQHCGKPIAVQGLVADVVAQIAEALTRAVKP